MTKEPQYKSLLKVRAMHGVSSLGLMANESWNTDPRRLVFTLARYKFVSKMLAGKKHVLEVGCADAFGTRIVQQTVGKVTACDFDPIFIEDIKRRYNEHWPMTAIVHDIIERNVNCIFDGIYALDVLEHIEKRNEDTFMKNILHSLDHHCPVILGMPSFESQRYASKASKEGHVNCKSGEEFREFMLQYFNNVFMFSMSDEVVHTGFMPMAHYLIAIGV